jgi:cysteine-rich repeat protein
MKKLAIVCAVMFEVVLISGSAFAAFYKAGAPTMSLGMGQCKTRTISLDGSDWGTTPLMAGGMYITTDPLTVDIASVQCYDGELTPAVWYPGTLKVDEPEGAYVEAIGDYGVLTLNLGYGVLPSSNILICDVEFCSVAEGRSIITIDVDTDPSFAMWVNFNFVTWDSTISPATINVTVAEVCGNEFVETGEQCDDGNVVDGDCCSSTCQFEPLNSPCPDGLYCNGAEDCNGAGLCQSGTPVDCPDDGLFCTGDEYCNESFDQCDNTGDPCDPLTCIEITDECILLDRDADAIPDNQDNCPDNPNGPLLGTCTSGPTALIGIATCISHAECDPNGFCSKNQEDIYPPGGNGIGDACECEGDFNCDGDVDGTDASLFKSDFGRSSMQNPCPPCEAGGEWCEY